MSIPVSLPVRPLAAGDVAMLREAFEQTYLQQYGRLIDKVDIEVLAWTLTVTTGSTVEPPTPVVAARTVAPASDWRDVFDVGGGANARCAVFRRSELVLGSTLAGPAIVVEDFDVHGDRARLRRRNRR